MPRILPVLMLSMLSLSQHGHCVEQDNLKRSVQNAVAAFEQTNRRDWSYTVSRYENEEGDITQSVEQFDGAKAQGEQWTLISLNQHTPTAKQQARFSASKTEQGKAEGQSFKIKLAELIQLDSLTLKQETEHKVIAEFDVNLPRLGDEASEALRGTLTLNKHDGFIESLRILNTEAFSVMFTAKIESFELVLEFINIDGATLPKKQTMSMTGKFALFTQINEVSEDNFTDYQRVTRQAKQY